MPVAPDCSCGGTVALTYGRDLFPARFDLADVPFWECRSCKRRVGCHTGTTEPMGQLADDRTRRARAMAHKAFDPLWVTGPFKRHQAYTWLAEKLGMPRRECHIGRFSVAQCEEVVRVCEQTAREKRP
jgi:hypothetical protein